MKTFTIWLPDVDAAMLVELQKKQKVLKDLQCLLLKQIRQAYQKAVRVMLATEKLPVMTLDLVRVALHQALPQHSSL